MAALPDWLKKNIPKASLGTALGAAAFLPDVANIAKAESKLTAISKALASMYFWMGKIFAPLRQALVGGWMILGFNAIGKAINSLVRDTGSLEAALRRLQSIRGFERQFTTLTGSLSAAKQRVAELLALSQRGPFKFEDIAEASRSLEVLTRGAMSGANATRTIGNVAIATGNGINDVATAVGQFYSNLKAGQPIEGAAEQLRQMGVVSNITADRLKEMAANGAPATVIFSTLTEALDRTHSSLQEAADDLSTVTAEHEKAVEEMKARFGAPWTQSEIQSTKNMTAAFVAITPALEAVSKSMATVYSGFSTTSSWLAKIISQSPMVQSAIEGIGKAFAGLAVAMAAAGTVLSVIAFPAVMAQATSLATSITSFLMPALIRMGLTFTAITQAGIILAGTLRVIAALLIGGAITGGVIALVGVVINLGLNIKKMVDAHQQMRQAFNQANDAILKQINAIRTLADKHEALAKALEASAAAEKRYRDLQNDPKAAGRLDYLFRLAEAHRQAKAARQTAREAAQAAGAITPESQELARAKMQEKRHQEEIDFQRTQSRGGPEARISSARERAAVLEERAKRGMGGVEKKAELAEELAPITQKTIKQEARKREAEQTIEEYKGMSDRDKAKNAFRERDAQNTKKDADERLKLLRKNANQIREQAKFAETPEGKGAAIERLQRQMQGATKEQQAGMRADIARLQIEQETLQIERDSVEANKERSEELKTQAELDERNLRLEKIRAQAELESARATGSPGERARKDFEITERRLKAEQAEITRLPEGEQNKERLAQLQAELATARTAERERVRGQAVTRIQTGLETAGVQARLAGHGEQAKAAEHLGNFVSKFEQLRQQFGDQEAKRLALQQEQNDIARESAQIVGHLKPVADSLTRIGGGGGVGGPTGDPQLIIEQRQLELQKQANAYLAAIEQALHEGGAPPEEGQPPQGPVTPPGSATPGFPAPAQGPAGTLPPGAPGGPAGILPPGAPGGPAAPVPGFAPMDYGGVTPQFAPMDYGGVSPASLGPTTPGGYMSKTKSISIGKVGAAGFSGQDLPTAVDTSGAGGERYYTPGADVARSTRELVRETKKSNDLLTPVATHSRVAGKSL